MVCGYSHIRSTLAATTMLRAVSSTQSGRRVEAAKGDLRRLESEPHGSVQRLLASAQFEY